MFRSSTRLWLLPDLGMDSRQLAPQAEYFSNMGTPPLADPTGCDSLAAYAVRSVDRWLSDQSVAAPNAHAFFIGGIGFGGILALEMALEFASRSLSPAGVLLIGSARSSSNIPRTFRLRQALLTRLPPVLGRWQLAQAFQRAASLEAMSSTNRRRLQSMAEELDWSQFKWQAKAMSAWNRHRSVFESSGFPIYQLHGRSDRQFRPPAVEDATLLIHGQQWINLSLASEVNRWIESIVRDHDLRQTQRCEA